MCIRDRPYTVRYFNWGEPSWEAPLEQTINPDVAVRWKGIMEKCTFCVQKIRRAQVEVEQRDGEAIDDEQLRTRNLNPACVQACPSDVLVFGDFNDPNSRVAELSHDERHYKLFEHLEMSISAMNIANDFHRELIGGAKMGRQIVFRLTSAF